MEVVKFMSALIGLVIFIFEILPLTLSRGYISKKDTKKVTELIESGKFFQNVSGHNMWIHSDSEYYINQVDDVLTSKYRIGRRGPLGLIPRWSKLHKLIEEKVVY